MPLLLGEHLVARVDVRADRTSGVLHVLGMFLEPAAPGEIAHVLADRRADLVAWLGLELGGGLDRVLGRELGGFPL